MGPLQRVVAMVVGGAVLSAIVWVGHSSPRIEAHQQRLREEDDQAWWEWQRALQVYDLKESEKRAEKSVRKAETRPRIADKPPYPKLAFRTNTFDFGTMHVGEEEKHSFEIRNVGKAPLIVVRGPIGCKQSPQGWTRREIEPGASADVEMNWKAYEVIPHYAKTAAFWTNDPDHPEIVFKVYGKSVANTSPEEGSP